MIYPTVDQLTKGEFNRYELVIGVAKCARIVTDEYVEQYNRAESMVANKETDKTIGAIISKELRDDKAVKTAIKRLAKRKYVINDESLKTPGKNVR